MDRLHANDNYMFSQEYDVRGWRFNYCYFIGYRKYAPQPSVDVCLINPMNKLRNRCAKIQCCKYNTLVYAIVLSVPIEDFPYNSTFYM